jgi:hypothetical protein
MKPLVDAGMGAGEIRCQALALSAHCLTSGRDERAERAGLAAGKQEDIDGETRSGHGYGD